MRDYSGYYRDNVALAHMAKNRKGISQSDPTSFGCLSQPFTVIRILVVHNARIMPETLIGASHLT